MEANVTKVSTGLIGSTVTVICHSSIQTFNSFLPYLCPPLKVKAVQLCLTLCDPMDYTVGYTKTPEWVAFPFSRGSSQPRDQTQVSHIAGGFFTS